MQIIKKQQNDIVTPDKIIIPKWKLDLRFGKVDCISLSFDGSIIWFGSNKTTPHPSIHRILNNDNTFDLRYWPKQNLISMWITQDIYSNLDGLKQAFISNNVKHVKDESCKLNINIKSVQFIFVELIDNEKYIVKCSIDELNEKHTFVDNSKYRIFHILSPSSKLKMLLKDSKLRHERYCYYIFCRNAWVSKHGSIDPAFYHLLMYEE